MKSKPIPLKTICQMVAGTLQGDPERLISSVNTPARAGPEEIALIAKGESAVGPIRAAALMVCPGSSLQHDNLIFVKDPYLAFAKLLDYFFPRQRFSQGIDSRAYVAPSARLGREVSLGPFCYVGENSRIGDHCEIHSGVTIYPDVQIGERCLIYANVVIREKTEIGCDVVVQPGAVIGGDGFGFTRQENGEPVKIPQVGRVVIGDHCEIGANTCIDRSTLEETALAQFVKLDNLVQIGHNVHIGRHTAISGQTGISGSVQIGERVIMGGQVGVADHIAIADGVMIAAKSGVSGSIKSKMVVSGYPHQEISKWRRNQAVLRNIADLRDKINELEKKIGSLEGK